MISTSTGASSGRAATPTALRACRPASPKTVAEQLARAVDDTGLAGEAGRAATNPTTLTTRATRSRSPTRLDGGERVERAGCAPSPSRRPGVDLAAPTMPVASSAPSTIGSWPDGVDERAGRAPPGTYAATGGTTSGQRQARARPAGPRDARSCLRPLQVGDQAARRSGRARLRPAPSRPRPTGRGSAWSRARAAERWRTPTSSCRHPSAAASGRLRVARAERPDDADTPAAHAPGAPDGDRRSRGPLPTTCRRAGSPRRTGRSGATVGRRARRVLARRRTTARSPRRWRARCAADGSRRGAGVPPRRRCRAAAGRRPAADVRAGRSSAVPRATPRRPATAVAGRAQRRRPPRALGRLAAEHGPGTAPASSPRRRPPTCARGRPARRASDAVPPRCSAARPTDVPSATPPPTPRASASPSRSSSSHGERRRSCRSQRQPSRYAARAPAGAAAARSAARASSTSASSTPLARPGPASCGSRLTLAGLRDRSRRTPDPTAN